LIFLYIFLSTNPFSNSIFVLFSPTQKLNPKNEYKAIFHIFYQTLDFNTDKNKSKKKMQPIHDFRSIIGRYPEIKLSYETISHKKVSGDETISVAIPPGKKHVLWTTVRPGTANGVAYLLELGKNHQNNTVILRGNIVPLAAPIPMDHKMGSIVYGTLILNRKSDNEKNGDTSEPIFIIDDIYMFKGQPLDNMPWGDRVPLLAKFMHDVMLNNDDNESIFAGIQIAVAVMWKCETDELTAGYNVRHIQYRECDKMAPYINVLLKKPGQGQGQQCQSDENPKETNPDTSASTRHVLQKLMMLAPLPKFSYMNRQFQFPTVFLVSANIQYDIYNLFAMGGKDKPKVFVGFAAIQNYKTSVLLNRVFRNIKENANLDAIEESDDEKDFENVDETKYVDLEKCVAFECVFNHKMKKWMPVRQIGDNENKRVVHICSLTVTN